MKKSNHVSQGYFSEMMADFGVFSETSINYLSRKFCGRPSSRMSEKSRELTYKMEECITLMETQEEEINVIKSALKQCDHDVVADNKARELADKTCRMFQGSARVRRAYESQSLACRIALFNHLHELLNSYPCLSSDESVTLDEVNGFYKDSEQHHAEVLSTLGAYLPETYAALAASRRAGYGLASKTIVSK